MSKFDLLPAAPDAVCLFNRQPSGITKRSTAELFRGVTGEANPCSRHTHTLGFDTVRTVVITRFASTPDIAVIAGPWPGGRRLSVLSQASLRLQRRCTRESSSFINRTNATASQHKTRLLCRMPGCNAGPARGTGVLFADSAGCILPVTHVETLVILVLCTRHEMGEFEKGPGESAQTNLPYINLIEQKNCQKEQVEVLRLISPRCHQCEAARRSRLSRPRARAGAIIFPDGLLRLVKVHFTTKAGVVSTPAKSEVRRGHPRAQVLLENRRSVIAIEEPSRFHSRRRTCRTSGPPRGLSNAKPSWIPQAVSWPSLTGSLARAASRKGWDRLLGLRSRNTLVTPMFDFPPGQTPEPERPGLCLVATVRCCAYCGTNPHRDATPRECGGTPTSSQDVRITNSRRLEPQDRTFDRMGLVKELPNRVTTFDR
ncbi:hypothetical protein VTK56DRAFT_3505 [Thermocarpiscus australiensis]